MPRNRQGISRDEKIEGILEATELRLRSGGYDAVSVPEIARQLGVAHNAIYWYFPSKDELVVATLEHMITKLLKRKPRTGVDTTGKILWFVEQLGDLYPVRASLQARAASSRVVADYLNDLNNRLQAMARNVLRPYVDEDELEITVVTFLATVQGVFVGYMKPRVRKDIVRFALDKLMHSSS